MTDSFECDVLVIGAGISGVAFAANLAENARVVVLEREAIPGYHTTGRSAAVFSEIYGNETVRALTRASRAFLAAPPAGFSDVEIMQPRGALFVGDEDGVNAFAPFSSQTDVRALTRTLDVDGALKHCPILRRERIMGALYEPGAADLDVHALYQGYIKLLYARGGRIERNVRLDTLEFLGSQWIARTRDTVMKAPVVVNAAGAWVDEVAATAGIPPIGIEPRKRTMVAIDAPEGCRVSEWPMVIDMAETHYFKPDIGVLLLSPADETLTLPCDAQPDELDVAFAIDRFENATGLRVTRVRRKWAGLRNFVADHSPVVGSSPSAKGFFWYAAQGGFGIQMAPALAEFGACVLLGRDLPEHLASLRHCVDGLSPVRLRHFAGLTNP